MGRAHQVEEYVIFAHSIVVVRICKVEHRLSELERGRTERLAHACKCHRERSEPLIIRLEHVSRDVEGCETEGLGLLRTMVGGNRSDFIEKIALPSKRVSVTHWKWRMRMTRTTWNAHRWLSATG